MTLSSLCNHTFGAGYDLGRMDNSGHQDVRLLLLSSSAERGEATGSMELPLHPKIRGVALFGNRSLFYMFRVPRVKDFFTVSFGALIVGYSTDA